MAKKRQITIPSYTFRDTLNPNVQQYIDRKGDWTHYWNIKQKAFKPAVNHILHLGYNKGDRFHEYLLSMTKEEAQKRLLSAGEAGSRTHRAIYDLLGGLKIKMTTKFFDERTNRQEPLTDDEWYNLESWLTWIDDWRPATIEFEYSLDSDVQKRGFAGTPDYICTVIIPDGPKCASGAKNPFLKKYWGKRVLIAPLDWKTSSGVWKEYQAQTAAYNTMITVDYFSRYKKWLESFDGFVFTGVLRLGTRHASGYEFVVWDKRQTKSNMELFVSAYRQFLEEEGEFKPKVRDIPTEIFVSVPKAKPLTKKSTRKGVVKKSVKKKTARKKAAKRVTRKKSK
jgi:hypothetical protein